MVFLIFLGINKLFNVFLNYTKKKYGVFKILIILLYLINYSLFISFVIFNLKNNNRI